MKNTVLTSQMEVIASYMDDEKRELIHLEFAPCSNVEFLKKYIGIDPDFSSLLSDEFGIYGELCEIREIDEDGLLFLDGAKFTEKEMETLKSNPHVSAISKTGSGYTCYLVDRKDFDFYI